MRLVCLRVAVTQTSFNICFSGTEPLGSVVGGFRSEETFKVWGNLNMGVFMSSVQDGIHCMCCARQQNALVLTFLTSSNQSSSFAGKLHERIFGARMPCCIQHARSRAEGNHTVVKEAQGISREVGVALSDKHAMHAFLPRWWEATTCRHVRKLGFVFLRRVSS